MDSKTRFSNRVKDYIKYRPSYPEEMIIQLLDHGIISNSRIIADLGSGTGILSQLLLPHVNKLYAVEPNEAMRVAAEELLVNHNNFISVSGSAEATTIANQSVDCIIAAQSFHWFDQAKAAKEFSRILKDNGYVVLIWNERLTEESEFLRVYENLLIKYATDYSTINHVNFTPEVLGTYFHPRQMEYLEFPNLQQFNWEQLLGRLHSCSYCPAEESSDYLHLTAQLRELYNAQNIDGKVDFKYRTRVFYSVWH